MKVMIILRNLILLIVIVIGFIYGIIQGINGEIYLCLNSLSIIPVMLIPIVVNKYTKIKISKCVEIMYYIFIVFSQLLGSIFNFYDTYNFYDNIVHLLSGILSSLMGIVVLVLFKQYKSGNIWFNTLFIIVFGLAVANLWEVYEFIIDNIFNKNSQLADITGVKDTMHDVIAALIGIIIFCIIYVYSELTNKKLITCFIKELNTSE